MESLEINKLETKAEHKKSIKVLNGEETQAIFQHKVMEVRIRFSKKPNFRKIISMTVRTSSN